MEKLDPEVTEQTGLTTGGETESGAGAPGSVSRRGLLQAALILATGGAAAAAPRRSSPKPSPAGPARDSMRRGVDYLERTQESDGSWQHYPGITALGVMAVAAAEGAKHPAVKRGSRFLAGMAKPNGGIYDDRDPARALPNYNTALSLR